MTIPANLNQALQEALEEVRSDPSHQLGPATRATLYKIFPEIDTPVANLARRWLAVLTGKYVLPLWSPPDYEKYHYPPQPEDFPEELVTQTAADYALELAEKVIMGEATAEFGSHVAGEAWVGLGYCMSLPSMLAEIAANIALSEACNQDFSRWEIDILIKQAQNPASRFSRIDAAITAAHAFACYLDPEQVAPDAWPEGWNWWVKEEPLDPSRLLTYWEWWLREAFPEAWRLAEEMITS
ncbi:MAG: hypothetical protein KC708_10405 [Anaerolineae bacterium]|nr:hypothetical protein [Anaerolineae bacterium]